MNNEKHNSEIEVTQTEVGGWVYGMQPEGCRLCIKGMKLVYFSGGDCNHPPHCAWYCPISKERRIESAHFADELPIKNYQSIEETVKMLIYEAKMIEAHGMSFTGGDPLSSLAKVDRVVEITQAMKSEFGADFHIHLYTSGSTFNSLIADRLEHAGLDDLRFHPDRMNFDKINLAIGRKYSVGAEVPVIPSEENHQYLLQLGDHLVSIGADYLNLNEFEMCEPNQRILLARNFRLDPNSIARVEGSARYARRFLQEFHPRGALTINFCPVAIKDGVQLRERYLRRANHISYPFELVNPSGTLIFMRIEGTYQDISQIFGILQKESGMPEQMMNFSAQAGILDVSAVLAEDTTFLDLIKSYGVKAGVYEILPFREAECAEIREYTPIFDYRTRKS